MRDEPRLPGFFRGCEGFAVRTFTVTKTGGELRVSAMGGARRRRAPRSDGQTRPVPNRRVCNTGCYPGGGCARPVLG